MKLTTQKRIEQIRHGNVPEGYKKTRLGIVPDEWKEIRFKEMFSRISRRNVENDNNVLTISAQYGLISQQDFFNKSVAGEDKSNYFLLRKGEFAYNKSYSNGYPYGALKRLDMYEKGIVSPLYICFSATDENKCPEFYAQYFEAGKMNGEFQAIAQEGARNHGLLNISVDDFFNSRILQPPLAEQQKIVKILTTQDRVIELEQQRIEELKKIKKYFLNKMFLQKGQSVPEIRFEGFMDAWEQRKLGELVRLNGRIGFRGYTQKDIITKEEGGILTFSPTNIVDNRLTLDAKNTYITQVKYDESPEIKIDNGDILFVKTGSTLGKSALVTGLSEPASINPQIVVMRTRPELRCFLYAQLISDLVQKQVAAVKIGGAVPTMTETKIKDFDISVPVDSNESADIGDFFSNLDNIITLHQRKLEEEKQKKKALMQLLLTGIVRV